MDSAEAPRRWRDSCVVLANVNKRVWVRDSLFTLDVGARKCVRFQMC